MESNVNISKKRESYEEDQDDHSSDSCSESSLVQKSEIKQKLREKFSEEDFKSSLRHYKDKLERQNSEASERNDELYNNIIEEIGGLICKETSEVKDLQKRESGELRNNIEEVYNIQKALSEKTNKIEKELDQLYSVVEEQIDSYDGYRSLSMKEIEKIPSKIVEIINSSLLKKVFSLESEIKTLRDELSSMKSNSLFSSPPSRPATSYSEDSTVFQGSNGGYFDSVFGSPIKFNPTTPSNRRDAGHANSAQSVTSGFWNRNSEQPGGFYSSETLQTHARISELEERIIKIEKNSIERKEISEKFIDFKEVSPFKELVLSEKENLPGEEEGKFSPSIDGNIIGKFFQKLAASKIPNSTSSYTSNNKEQQGYRNYSFSRRVIDEERSLKEWCEADFSLAGSGNSSKATTYNNKFFANDLEKTFSFTSQLDNPRVVDGCKDFYLATGSGKSTHVVRCLACHNREKGVTVVVPNSSLVGSFITSHNEWLSKGKDLIKDENGDLVDDPKKRVTVCQICSENHAKEPYQVVHKGEADLINVFTVKELIEAYCLNREIIKEIIVFDEAHVEDPFYKNLISFFASLNRASLANEGSYAYKIIRTSATFSNLPSSSRLTGTISDYYVSPSSIADFCHSKKGFLNKKTIVFCSDFNYLDFKVLDENGIDYLALNEELEGYATQLVQSTKSKLIIADSSYSLGFNFGDVNVISTGISSRNVIKREKRPGSGNDNFSLQKEVGRSEFSDLIQERGRCAREKNHSGTWVSFLSDKSPKEIRRSKTGENEARELFTALNKLKGKKLVSLSELGSSSEKILEALGDHHFNKKGLSDRDREKSFAYLRDIFLKTLCDEFLKKTLFSSKNKEGNMETKFTFENELISVVKDQIQSKEERINHYKSIIRISSWEMMKKHFELEYSWARRTQFDENDEDYDSCFKFRDAKDAEIASFIISLRDSEECYEISEGRSEKSKKSCVNITLKKKFINKNKQIALKSFNEK